MFLQELLLLLELLFLELPLLIQEVVVDSGRVGHRMLFFTFPRSRWKLVSIINILHLDALLRTHGQPLLPQLLSPLLPVLLLSTLALNKVLFDFEQPVSIFTLLGVFVLDLLPDLLLVPLELLL